MKKIISITLAVIIGFTAVSSAFAGKPKLKSFTEKEYGEKYKLEYIGGNIYYEADIYDVTESDYLDAWRSFGYEIDESSIQTTKASKAVLYNMMLEALGIPPEARKTIMLDRVFKYSVSISDCLKYGDKIVWIITALSDDNTKVDRKSDATLKVATIYEKPENKDKYVAKNLKYKEYSQYFTN